MRAAIYNPYLDTLGGGERYTLSFAKVLAELGWSVNVEWKNTEISKKLERRFGIDLSGIDFIPDVKRGDGYDLCFWVSDGSIPTLRARKNILHFQVPFHGVGGGSLLNKMKLFRINKVICNSLFTKSFIDKEYGVQSLVIYPPVDIDKIKPRRKESVILSVARFSKLKQSKRQDVLIKTFKKMIDGGLSGWKLVLAGGVEVGVADDLEALNKMTRDYPIEIVKSPDYPILKELYGTAQVFWSAAGFEVDEEKNPENVEHFGITVVEAMAAGSIPVVFAAGGHKEIVDDGNNGFLWHNTRELVEMTVKAIKGRAGYAKAGVETCKRYSFDEFRKNIQELL